MMFAIAWKATVILAAAFAAAALLRERPAALRHFLWTAAFAALLVLPVLVGRMPELGVAAPQVAVGGVANAGAAPLNDGRSSVRAVTHVKPAVDWIAVLYGAGLLGTAAWFLIGAARTARLVGRAQAAPELGADVVATAEAPVPLAWGIWRPAVVLPAAALEWPRARLASALLHERMHHRRRDLLAQAVAQAACCLFWFHPLAWLALAKQRVERERACDDAVLREGVAAHEYATHLMEMVRALAGRRHGWADAPAMAEGSGLETRVRAVLDGRRDRRPLSRGAAAGIAAAMLALLAPLAALQLRAQAAGTLAGIVRDPSGARVPGCRVTAKNADGVHEESTVTGAVGDYRFSAVPAGHYTLEFASRGFKLGEIETELVAGATNNVDANLEVGQTVETVVVTGRTLAAASAQQPKSAPQRIPVGGNVQACKLIRQTRPVYPQELQDAGVEGSVIIRAIIGKDGTVLHPQVVNTAIDPRLAQAALDAVSHWLYQPTLLNGQPIETITTINVGFELAH